MDQKDDSYLDRYEQAAVAYCRNMKGHSSPYTEVCDPDVRQQVGKLRMIPYWKIVARKMYELNQQIEYMRIYNVWEV